MPEPLALAALALGFAALFASPVVSWATRRPRVAALVLAAAAALLSTLWVVVYLRGGPRIIDATAYYLSGRAMSEGHLTWEVGSAPASTMGRFLVRGSPDSHNMSVIFPPGYPAVLAVGFVLGAPMAIGPVLAALAAWLTFELGRTAARQAGIGSPVLIGVSAGALSVVCGALRYHTADTMSHGLSAVCVAAGLLAALRLRDASSRSWARLAGAAIGLCVAARPVSGLALFVLVVLSLGRRLRVRDVLAAALAATPFLLLLFLHQWAVTGAPFTSSQALYYALSDGPPGCFGYGFGDGIGCLHEHGDFVRANLKGGYGFVAALGTTLRRLKMHGVDAFNAEPLAIVLLVPALIVALRTPALRALGLALPVFIALYAPFYFDGNYPGGGARFFADVLPVEHVLVALLVPRAGAWLAGRHGSLASLTQPEKAAAVMIALSLLGFGLRGHTGHEALRDREGGRPMFRSSDLPAEAEGGAFVFVDTDHGFLLGFDPNARADQGDIEVLRYRGDDNDLFGRRGQSGPPAYRHRYDVATGWVFLEPFEPKPMGLLRADSFWPAARQARGFATPSHASARCAGGKRVLAFSPDETGAFDVELALPHLFKRKNVRFELVLGTPESQVHVAAGREVSVSLEGSASGELCVLSDWSLFYNEAGHQTFRVVGTGDVALLALHWIHYERPIIEGPVFEEQEGEENR